eukprot:13336793-Ditylum_brightwellii.AAC.1
MFVFIVGFYFLICSTPSLRGNEGFKTEAQGFIENADHGHVEENDLLHVVILLLCRFKGKGEIIGTL